MAVRLGPTMTISFMGLLHWGVGGGHRDFVGNVLKPPTRPDCCVARCSESSCTRTYTAVPALRAPCTRAARYGFKWFPVDYDAGWRIAANRGGVVDSMPVFEQFAADQHAPDFVGAGADRVQIGRGSVRGRGSKNG